ncbi:hypothetical protein AAC387_Pa10g0828 [Persea americana]
MHDFNVILGMDWLARYQVVMDCFEKTVRLFIDGSYDTIEFVGERRSPSARMISALKAERMMKARCEGYIAFVSKDKKSKGVDEIPVVCEFPDVFPDEILGFHPVREIDFAIELAPGTTPISRAPYRMALAKLRELKVKLQELLDKGFIRPSMSMWGVPGLSLSDRAFQ